MSIHAALVDALKVAPIDISDWPEDIIADLATIVRVERAVAEEYKPR
jgi:hypothetical protein